jgi:hypothetical protein
VEGPFGALRPTYEGRLRGCFNAGRRSTPGANLTHLWAQAQSLEVLALTQRRCNFGEAHVLAVIPAFNAAETIEAAIESLVAQDWYPLEIIVVDDGSSDNTPEILKMWEGRVLVKRHEVNQGLARVLNGALSLAKDDGLLFILQDDCELLERSYIRRLVSLLGDGVGAACGEWTFGEDLSPVEDFYIRYYGLDFRDRGRVHVPYTWLKADLFVVEALRKAGGFESAGPFKFGAEEHLIGEKLRRAGYLLIKDSDLMYRVRFSGEATLGKLLQRECIYGRAVGWALARDRMDLRSLGSVVVDQKVRRRRRQFWWWAAVIAALSVASLSGTLELGAAFVGVLAGELVLRTVRWTSGLGTRMRVLAVVVELVASLVYVLSFAYGVTVGFWGRTKERVLGLG